MLYHKSSHGHIYSGNSLDILSKMDNKSVNCCVTSPPYWNLRDYGTGRWEGGDPECSHMRSGKSANTNTGQRNVVGGTGDDIYKSVCNKCGAKRIDKQIGLEDSMHDYISNLCDIFDEVMYVLRNDGTLFVNIGDTYATVSGNQGRSQKYNGQPKVSPHAYNTFPKKHKSAIPHKSLCMIPFHFAIEMVKRGWILRNTLIWHKPNCMPSSARDRFTVDFEYMFFFVKSRKYWFETQYEPLVVNSDNEYRKVLRVRKKYNVKAPYTGNQPYAHPIGGTKHTGNNGSTTYSGNLYTPSLKGRYKRAVWTIPTKPYKEAHFAVYNTELIRTPIAAGCPPNGIVLDPFFGSGTTAIEAISQGKNYIGIDLNQDYCSIAAKRIDAYLNQTNIFDSINKESTL